METLINNLFRATGQPLALYLYSRLVRDQLPQIDPTVVSVIASDFATFGTSSSEEGLALVDVVLGLVTPWAPTLTVADMSPFMIELGTRMQVDYPASGSTA
jgi:hypothetical protein